MGNISWIFTKFISLTWWQMILWGSYFIYFIVRTWAFWDETRESLWKGYKRVIFSYEKYFRVYHIIRIIFDIPPALLGLLFPILRKLLAFKIYEFKSEK
jgi:hypothetical protein